MTNYEAEKPLKYTKKKTNLLLQLVEIPAIYKKQMNFERYQ